MAILRSRIGRIKPQNIAGHPDANLLAAFAENTLSPGERATILSHLADCGDCRECLALASSAVSIQRSESKRRFSPAWRWAAPAAALAAVCLLLIVYQRGFITVSVQPKTNALPPTSAPPPTMKREPPQAVQLARNEQPKLVRKTPRTRTAAIPPPPSVPPPEVPGDAVIGGTVSQAAALPAPPAAPPLPPTAPSPANSLLPQMRAHAELNKSGESFVSPPASRAFSAPLAKLKKSRAPSFLWSINAGSVQLSADGGKTWEAVPVSEGTVFRALSAEDSEIWAGGSNGALFHSSDAGARWQQVKVADDHAQLSGDIVSINARNSPRIEITTDSGEQWISEDGGVKWRRGRFGIR